MLSSPLFVQFRSPVSRANWFISRSRLCAYNGSIDLDHKHHLRPLRNSLSFFFPFYLFWNIDSSITFSVFPQWPLSVASNCIRYFLYNSPNSFLQIQNSFSFFSFFFLLLLLLFSLSIRITSYDLCYGLLRISHRKIKKKKSRIYNIDKNQRYSLPPEGVLDFTLRTKTDPLMKASFCNPQSRYCSIQDVRTSKSERDTQHHLPQKE